MAGFEVRLSPWDICSQPSRRSWEMAYSAHKIRIGGTCPVSLNATLGSGFLASTLPHAGCPPPVPHRAGTAGILARQAASPSKLPPGILGRGIPEFGILRRLEPVAGAGEPSVAGREGWAAPQVEIPAGVTLPGLTETGWESCATIAPEPAERWLSLVLAIEPLLAPKAAAAPRFAIAAETPDCFRDIAAAPPALVETWMPGLAPEAVERWLQPSLAHAMASATPTIQPPLTLAMDSAAPAAADWAQVPAPEAAERWIEASQAEHLAAGCPAASMQPFGMWVQGAEIFRDPAEMPPPVSEAWVPAAAAEPVESWLETASAEAVWIARVSVPQLSIAVPACAPALAGALPGLAAEAVERWIETAMANALAVSGRPIQRLPFAVAPQTAEIFRDPADAPPPMANFARVPAAEAAESWIEAASAPEASWSPAPVRMPAAGIAAIVCAPQLAAAAAAPPAEAVERCVEPVVANCFAAAEQNLSTLPFAVGAQAPAVLGDPADVPPPISETWMPVPAAEPVERWIRTAVAEAPAPAAAITTPAFSLAVVEPFVPFIPRFARPQAAEPAAAFVRPVFRPIPMHPQVAFPPMRIPQTSRGATGNSATLAGAASGLRAAPLESMPASGKTPIPIRRAPAMPGVPEAAPRPARLSTAGVTEIYPAAARSKSETPHPVELNPVETLTAQAPPVEIERPTPQMPEPELHSLEYYCEGGNGSPSRRLHWEAPAIPPTALRFQMKPALESLEEQAPPKTARTEPAIAEIFSLPEARQRASRSDLGWVGKIAAGLMVAFALWSGSKIANFGKQVPAVARDNSAPQHSMDSRPLVALGGEAQAGPMTRLRQAIATRAAVSVGDTFHGGMESWGTGPKSWAPGWSHSPDGYVRVGDLALFQPTRNFSDYRLEFYGQIEKKSISWVMRAKDKQNYYAMKFKVVEPGLRPVIAMVHYPVVDGKKGHRIETPLSVMVHNNTPYHVTVDVRGNHFTASIEGEQVDSWTDDAPGTGAVGFFSEAGEAARLYWAKVSKNQDWIGHFCSYLAGDEARRTAELWNPTLPETPAPVDPRPRDFVVTAACEVEPEEDFAPRAASISKNWSNPLWIS
jgi:hypothetical protein